MFSGIVQALGKVSALENNESDGRLTIESALFTSSSLFASSALFASSGSRPVKLGDSIAVAGVCLTINDLTEGSAIFDLSSETLRRTTLGGKLTGDYVNLEPALRMGDSLDGHMVQGHVEEVVTVLSRHEEGQTVILHLEAPRMQAKYLAPKGSVTLDGVSLTVCELSGETFSVYLVPYTMQHTTFQYAQVGTNMNFESDCIARYVERLLSCR